MRAGLLTLAALAAAWAAAGQLIDLVAPAGAELLLRAGLMLLLLGPIGWLLDRFATPEEEQQHHG